MRSITEPAKAVNIVDEVDVCVLGGGCTGTFAAVRAARLGARVAIVEKHNCFGGVGTSGAVGIWHSLKDSEDREQIIAGLTLELIEKLGKRDAVDGLRINTEELKIELDELVTESGVNPYLHSFYSAPYIKDGSLDAVIIENKDGRNAIRAKIFIDATGDGDLCRDLGIPCDESRPLQPPSLCSKIYGLHTSEGFDWEKAFNEHCVEYGLKKDMGWCHGIPGIPEITLHAATHIFDVDCSVSSQLTYSEIMARKGVRVLMDIIRKHGPENGRIHLVQLASTIGIRETRHVRCLYTLTEKDVLHGRKFEDGIANGAYPVDHNTIDPTKGYILRYLNGIEKIHSFEDHSVEIRRWREETENNPTYYQIPYRSLVPGKFPNLLVCGRALDADKGAFGAVRVMTILNQTGEAAGTAAYLALAGEKPVTEIETGKLKKVLKEGGSIIL